MNLIVIWASANTQKFWYKIFIHLLEKYKNVIPIHPTTPQIEGVKCVSSVNSLHTYFDVAVFVVNPEITLKILQNNNNLFSWKKLWFQPWSYNQEVLDYCVKNNFNFEAKECVLKTEIDFI